MVRGGYCRVRRADGQCTGRRPNVRNPARPISYDAPVTPCSTEPAPTVNQPLRAPDDTKRMDADWLARARLSNAVRSGDVLWFDLTDAATGQVWSACQTGWESDQRCRQFEHEYALNEALEPAWALMPVALIRAADGPVLVYPRPDVRGFDTLADGRLLLRELIEHATRREFVYRHDWREGDLVIWDNRCTMHKANADYPEGSRRYMLRVIVEGTVPV